MHQNPSKPHQTPSDPFPRRTRDHITILSSYHVGSGDEAAAWSMDPVSSAALGAAFGVALDELFKLTKHGCNILSKSSCKKHKAALERLIPTINELCAEGSESSEHCHRQLREFQGKLRDALQLLTKCEQTSCFNLYKKFQYGRRLGNLENYINDFLRTQGLANLMLDVKKMNSDVKKMFEIVSKLKNDSNLNTLILQQMSTVDDAEPVNSSFPVPEMLNSVVGFSNFITDLKELVFQSHVNVIGVEGTGGLGKTTLAKALCNDQEVKVVYCGNKWASLVTCINFLNFRFLSRQYTFHYCFSNPKSPGDFRDYVGPNYCMPLLQEEDALSLFCISAFGQTSIPSTEDESLVKQVQAECKCLPLALKVIGSSLRGEPSPVWESAKNKLSRAESIGDYYNRELLNRLKLSIDVLDDEVKQCFLDLGAFPEGRKICIDALLDIWVYARGMEWNDAFVILLELASRNLLDLTSVHGSRAVSYGCGSEISFSQHDVIRDLALHLASQDSVIHRKTLFMPQKEDGLPMKWQALKNHASKAQIVSIHTGVMDERQWSPIDFPHVEALVLLFAESEYYLPIFLHAMPKLKLITILLERLIIPPFYEHCRSLENLEKLSLSLCEGLGNMMTLDKKITLEFPKLREINVDHCSDLEELPIQICDLTFLQRLSITNCHLIHKLPDDLGRLGLLQVLQMSACPSLAALPPSLGNFKQLEFLDISHCRCLKDLPVGLDQLARLKMLDMRECTGVRQVPEAIGIPRSLRRVICDEKIEQQWLFIKDSIMHELIVEAVEEHFNVDWLDD
eukprot:Gb_29643 [translate_table: standard]